MFSSDLILLGFLGGFLPALLWLWFWQREDSLHPEPKKLVFLTFIAGMAMVPVVLYLERSACEVIAIGKSCSIATDGLSNAFIILPLIIVWAAIEEIAKFFAAFIAVLWRKEVHEPIDPLIFLITAALGFAALENAFFIMNAADTGSLAAGLKAAGLRFLGATLLHTLCSAMIGIALAFAFYKKKGLKLEYLLTGIVASITLHTLFNFLIIESNGEKTFAVFASVWAGIILVILVFEKVKRIRPTLSFFLKR